jgi:ABC-type multidrug transport system ATPase subunit
MEALGRDVQQIVFLARAMLGRPRLLLLDEPMAGLDLFARYRVREALRELRQVYGVAILVTTREHSEAESLADRFAVLEHGRLIAVETPQPVTAPQPDWPQVVDRCPSAMECLEI